MKTINIFLIIVLGLVIFCCTNEVDRHDPVISDITGFWNIYTAGNEFSGQVEFKSSETFVITKLDGTKILGDFGMSENNGISISWAEYEDGREYLLETEEDYYCQLHFIDLSVISVYNLPGYRGETVTLKH